MWRITYHTIADLHKKYLEAYPENAISYGSFFSLRPFYVRSVTTRDIEVCCCKVHLHARWSISALLTCIQKHGINPTEFKDYYSFFDYLTEDCVKDLYAHISWSCTPNKSTVCEHISSRWKKFVDNLLADVSDDSITVRLEHFENVLVKTKFGEKKRLKQVTTDANLSFILSFIDQRIQKIIHHRNELKHFRSVVAEFGEMHNSIYLDLDFSENLTIPMKHQPQSMYWTQETVTIHSGITKSKDGKMYHPYVSNSKKHDQVFTNIVINEMLAEEDATNCDVIIVDSDNCSSQYKSGLHFYHLQEISNNYNTMLIRMYGIPSHGKGEVDHVGGTAKVTVRRMAASGEVFKNASDIVVKLNEKYADSTTTKYVIKEITEEELNSARRKATSIIVSIVDGSSAFRALVFKPGENTFRASTRLCICDECKNEYGSCTKFSDYSLTVQLYQQPFLRSTLQNEDVDDYDDENKNDNEVENIAWDFLCVDSFVAVAADKSSQDAMWFIKITENDCISNQNETDSYGNVIIPGKRFLKGQFLERAHISKDYILLKLSKLSTYFYRETIVYPFVPLQETKKGFKLINTSYTDILHYVENHGFSSL